ncbi:MAG: trypsin-like peptidase domain-containing protein [Candidatus Acidiferrales bacterium]|jgi:DNA-binding response OmpR family regulator/S1-C subfamily serine protease
MNSTSEKIVIVEADAASREVLLALVRSAGYDASAFATAGEGLDAVRRLGADLLLLDTLPGGPADTLVNAGLPGGNVLHAHETIATLRGALATEGIRIILLVGLGAGERAAALDLGADDAVSQPFEAAELLARVRALLRARRADTRLLERTRLAEEGQQIAQTAFEALAVTEKMASDASSLNRRLKIGLGAVFAIVVVMAAIYFLLAHNSQKDMQRTTATIMRLERGLMHQQDVIAEVRRLRQRGTPDGALAGKDELQKQAADLQAQMTNAGSSQGAELQRELDETNARLKRVEQGGDSAGNFIGADVQSVCLLHISVAFREQQSGQTLRYAGLNQQGEPLQGSDGNPLLTIDGRGPEVRLDVFGTGFPAGADGRIITNRHVAEPWWNNDDISELTNQGFQPVISSIHAYFPGDPRAYTAEIEQISKDADLATMRITTQGLARPALSIDSAKEAAVTGQPIVLMGYATGLAAILARTDENTAQDILTQSGGDVSQVLDELARRNLIRPIITQGHIGDVLPDKIVFDAQTTSGGSGGPLFNQQGKVIGVTYAVLKGFGGSNFGIPIRLSEPLLSSSSAHPTN